MTTIYYQFNENNREKALNLCSMSFLCDTEMRESFYILFQVITVSIYTFNYKI